MAAATLKFELDQFAAEKDSAGMFVVRGTLTWNGGDYATNGTVPLLPDGSSPAVLSRWFDMAKFNHINSGTDDGYAAEWDNANGKWKVFDGKTEHAVAAIALSITVEIIGQPS